MTRWTSKPTGNMTLSVLDERNRQILKVDMLRYGIMKAGTSGDLLVRALNDLALIASFPGRVEADGGKGSYPLPYPDGGLSPLPWSVDYTPEKRLVVVHDADGRRIAEKKYAASFAAQEIESIMLILRSGLAHLTVGGMEHG